MSIKEELYEQYLLSESKADFISNLIPDSYEHLYFQVLHSLNTKSTLTEEDVKILTKLRTNYAQGKHENYSLHNLDFLNLLRVLDSQKSTTAQREQALKDLKNYFNIKFSAIKPNSVQGNEIHQSDILLGTQLETSLDQKLISFQNYLNQAYTSQHILSNIVPQALYKLDVERLLTEAKNEKNYAQILEAFVSNVPCLHQVKDVPKIYKAIYDDYQKRKLVFDFQQAGYDRLSLSQLKEFGTLMKDVVFETFEYQLALMKKLFFRDVSKFLNKQNLSLTQEDKQEKKKQYTLILTWVKSNLPRKLQYLQRLLVQELVLLNLELKDYNQELFLEFITNPPIIINQFTNTQRERYQQNIVQPNRDWSQIFQFSSLNSTQLLSTVENYLLFFYRTADSIKPFDSILEQYYLNKTFYKSKILSGQQEYITKSTSVYSQSEIESLVNSRQINILDSNNRYVKGNEQVKLQVEVKNIQNLTVNIFEIKTGNYYMEKMTQFDNTISLDGLIPLHTTEYTYKESSNQLVLREFNLEPIQKAERGIFIVEFFGNSISSRAVFKKGLLNIVSIPTIAGHLITIVDESQNICKPTQESKTGILKDGRFFSADENGQIIIPYESTQRTYQLILTHNDFSEIESFDVLTEYYNFECTYMYNQESFLQGNKSKVIIHPTLSVNGLPADMDIIEDQLIKVNIKNHQDIPTAIEFKDFKFSNKEDIQIEIPIQSIIKSIEIECTGVINKMDGTKQNLVSNNKLTFELHQVPQNQIFNLYLKNTHSHGYVVYALDKTGQPLEKVPIEFQLFHKKIYQNFTSMLQTDAEGKAILGQLDNINSITAQVKDFKNFPDIHQNWVIMQNYKTELPSNITITEEETVEIPIPSNVQLSRENITFYSVNQDIQEFVYEDLFEQVKQVTGFLRISNLKQGVYILHILELQSYITINVYRGSYWTHNKSFLITDNKFIQVDRSRENLISIKETLLVPQSETEADILVNLNLPESISEAQRNKIRVHVFAFNYLSNDQDNFVQSLRNNRIHKPEVVISIQSQAASFFNNKKIGDEICYVYNRKNELKRIGNTLEKPQVLLKRTFNRDTSFEKENLEIGQDFQNVSEVQQESIKKSKKDMRYYDCSGSERYCADIQVCPPGACHVKGEIDSFLNFLKNACFVTSNHQIQQDGSVIIPGFQWKNYSSIQVVVTSNNLAISDIFPTTSSETPTQDLRHVSSMKPDQFYTENFSSGKLNASQTLSISADSQTAVVGSIPEIFEIQKQLMKTGRKTDEYNGKSYSTWQFLKEWITFTDRQKLDKYNEFASHELNLFLYFKDNNFFKVVVEPFLKNKIQKSFIDYFLLGNKEEQLKYSNTERVSELNTLEQVLLIITLVKNNLKQRAECLASSIENTQKTQTKNIDLQKRLFLTIIESTAKDEIVVAQQVLMECTSFKSMAQKSRCYAAAPMQKMSLRSSKMAEQSDLLDLQCEAEEADDYFGGGGSMKEQLIEKRKEFKEGYKKLENTKEYIERQYYSDNRVNNYQNLVQVNKFWSDLARFIVNNNGIENFVSENFIYGFNNHVEAISVLSLMDIAHTSRDNYDLNSLPGRKIQIVSQKNVIYFSKEIVQSSDITKANVSIIQTFFDPNDRFTTLKDDPTVKIEKEVEEFVINKIYGCKVIVSNISIANLNLSILTEIPEGAIPVNSFEYTKSIDITVNSYQTYNNIEFFFYFPKAGTFNIYRSNASRNGIIIAQANEIAPIIVKQFNEIKKMENLSDILNNGSKEDILQFAKTQNLHDTQAFNINKILYIIQSDKHFFLSFLEILREQGVFSRNVWEYSLFHNYEQGVIELLNNQEFRKNRMIQIYQNVQSHNSDLLSYDKFQVFEYHPLLTSRTHSFMNQNKSKILNVQFKQTYNDYVNYLAHVAQPTSAHYLILSYYLILQERIDEALQVFGKIKESDLTNNSKIQYDYFAAYLDIYTGGPNFKRAREISQAYLEYPIISWRNLFVNIQNQLTEYDGEVLDESEVAENTDLSKNLKNAQKEQSMNFEIQEKKLIVYYQNAERATINLYQLDIEVLFSTQPFMEGGNRNEFTFIKPNHTINLNFEKLSTLEKQVIDIPAEYANKNLYIQLVSTSGSQILSYFSSSLKVQMIEKYGQVKILDEKNAPLQKVYVKCFAKYKDDSVQFFRDGYTDLRGRFDYALSSSSDINQVKQFSILISSEEHGSIIKKANPPTQTGSFETVSLLKKR
ncbi:hypothetical protein TTHERM_00565630 (macronuclear) [Tetrahymena thermophila SB210]|uniref:Uncharacterized protein n=1 Tax=Tetrahymena thermophila (strain SB210) TaxID=312017 RepID=I7MLD7_TETTS|nr:hypothetical protein TTHERM_00565630 [Tetrahymena thermophila SB210]EAS01818.2 hypothetical protein TTHERM_00565630 [Tetrahymena thermophila SB210]|eukprot:XP_001022063.2 hypothetical protein TTHERM_00565630 [Tetrahymena thermophila SB210]